MHTHDDLYFHLGGLGPYLTMRQVAAQVGLAYSTLRNLRSRGLLPEPDLIWEGKPCWLLADIEAWEAPTGRPYRQGLTYPTYGRNR